MGHAPQGIDLARHVFLPHPHHHQDRRQAHESHPVPVDRTLHSGRHAAAIADAQDRTGMLRAEPLDRFPDNEDIHAAEDRNYGREARALGRLLNRPAKHHVAGVNQPADQQGTRIPFHGDLKDPKVGIWSAVGQTLRNIFIQALTPKLEHSVSLKNVTKDKK